MLPSLPPRPNKKTTTYESPFLPLGIIQFPSLVAAGREEEEEERKRSGAAAAGSACQMLRERPRSGGGGGSSETSELPVTSPRPRPPEVTVLSPTACPREAGAAPVSPGGSCPRPAGGHLCPRAAPLRAAGRAARTSPRVGCSSPAPLGNESGHTRSLYLERSRPRVLSFHVPKQRDSPSN